MCPRVVYIKNLSFSINALLSVMTHLTSAWITHNCTLLSQNRPSKTDGQLHNQPTRVINSPPSYAVLQVTGLFADMPIRGQTIQGRRQGFRPGWAKFEYSKIRRKAPKKIFICPPWFSVCPPCHT